MTAYPTGTTGSRLKCLSLAGMLLFFAATAAGGTNPGEAFLYELQRIGADVRHAIDGAAARGSADPAEIAVFEQRMNRLRAAAPGATVGKLLAVERLLGTLRDFAAHPVLARARIPRDAVDMQAVTAARGASCGSALGLVESIPVTVTLSAAGATGSEAWFRFNPASNDRRYRLRTLSAGPDPALEVVADCRRTDVLAANDDELGLDAAVLVTSRGPRPLFVHLTNSAAAGVIELGVEEANGGITGKVVDAVSGQPLPAINVVVYSSYGNYWTSTSTDSSGNYVLSLAAGDYYLRTDDESYLPVLYPDVLCDSPLYFYNLSNCDTGAAQLITVSSGSVVTGINIAIPQGRRIEGTVRDSFGHPVSAQVSLYDAVGTFAVSIGSNSYGRYVFTPLPPGTYKAKAEASGFGKQLFNGIDCNGSLKDQCNLASATTIDVQSGDATGVNFALPKLATITGTVHRSGNSLGYFSVYAIDGNGSPIATTYYQTGTSYTLGPLGVGSYYVYAVADGFFPQIFNGIDCGVSCNANIAQATAITITGTDQVATADFDMTALPSVHGHITDAQSGVPQAGVLVIATQNPPSMVYPFGSATSDASGNYTMQVPAGTYYLWAQSADHIDSVYPNIDCEQFGYIYYGAICDVTGAVLLTVAPNQPAPAFDFALKRSSSISGHARVNAGPGSDLPAYASIAIFDGSGSLVASTSTDASGAFQVNDFPAGNYFAYAASNGYAQLLPQLWQQIDCVDPCAATTGTPIALSSGASVSNIDFLLVPRHAIAGRVSDLSDNGIDGALIDLFDAATRAYQGTAVTDAQGYYVAAGGNPSAYLVATDTGGTYLDQVFSNISCPNGSAYFGLCPLAGAAPVLAGSLNIQPVLVNFRLRPGDTVFWSGFEAN
jgi:5-hydroxyisourate hydrolase-like protein (transthyretin family)